MQRTAKCAMKVSAACGMVVVGTAYYQRLPRKRPDHRTEWSESSCRRLYRSVALPLVLQTDPETAHSLTLRLGKWIQSLRLLLEPSWTGPWPLDSLLRPTPSTNSPPDGPSVAQKLFDGRLEFETPFGVAAGFDKNADLAPLFRVGAIPGLGFGEIGSVSALPSEGNAKPRCFRLPEDESVINRMGLNNEGCEKIAEKFADYERLGRAGKSTSGDRARAPVGVNITKTHSETIMGEAAIEDFLTSFRKLQGFADFMVLNVSCPNTAEGKTFEDPSTFRDLLAQIKHARGVVSSTGSKTPPILVKLSPPQIDDKGRASLRELVTVALGSGVVDGFVISNTAGDRELMLSSQGRVDAENCGKGGLSGRPLRLRSTEAVREVYKLTKGTVPIIGVGGVDSPEAAYEKIRAGASLVEVYTGLIYNGPSLFSDMHVGLQRLLYRDGYSCVADAVGVDCA